MTKKQYDLYYKLMNMFANQCHFKPMDTDVEISDRCTSYSPAKGYTSMQNNPTYQFFNQIISDSPHILWWLFEKGYINEKKVCKGKAKKD